MQIIQILTLLQFIKDKQIRVQQIRSQHTSMQKQSIKNDQLQQYFIIKRTADLPPKINIIFSILQRAIQAPLQCQNSKQNNKAFLHTFSKLSIDQQARFMNQNIKYVVKYLCKKQQQVVPAISQIKHIQTTVQVYSTMLGIPIWNQYNFRLNQSKKQIVLANKKRSDTIDLYNYLVRKSKKFHGSIVLQGIQTGSKNQYRKYVLAFKQGIGQQVYQQLFKTVIYIKQIQLQQLLKTNQQQAKKNYSGDKNNMAFLSSKNINQFLNYKDGVLKFMLTGKFDYKKISVAVDKPYKMYQSQKYQKIFKLQADLEIQAKQAKQNFIKNFGNRKNKMIISSQVLESFSSRYTAVYQKYLFPNTNNKLQQLITIRQQTLNQNQDILFVKGIDLLMVKNFLQFLTVKIKPNQTNPTTSKLIIVTSIILSQFLTVDYLKLYLYTLYQNTQLKKSQQLLQSNSLKAIQQQQDAMTNKDQFRTVFGNVNSQNEQILQFVQGQVDEEIKDQSQHLQMQISHVNQYQVGTARNYLNHQFRMQPIQGFNKQGNLMTQHYLWSDWTRKKEGGVICTNQEIVNTQKRLFKQLLSRMGNKILKGQTNVLNISIPVIVFKKQSHLQSIARDFCYAPLILQKPTDSLQRVKYASILAISVGTLGISMQKPFNPLLGQTLQSWIGGCPIYLQQISHHPPIGSYYMLGRGYKIYGQIQPKISLGMNNVKGYSERPNYIQYDDGTKIEMVYGKMVIHGMLFGDRQFNYEDKIYVYDLTHHIFTEITFGPKKKGMLSKSAQPWDYVSGKIYQLKQEFKNKFIESKPRILPSKQYIVKQLSTLEGVWNDIITFDGVQYINFTKMLPCKIQQEQFPLLSQSKYRKDLIKLIQGNIQQAQKQKEVMQQIQRRQRKLREKYSNQVKAKLQKNKQSLKRATTI